MKTLAIIVSLTSLLVYSTCSSRETTTREDKQASKETQAPAMDLHTAALLGDADVILEHIEAGSDLDQQEPTVLSSPLITASVFGKTDAARALIEGGADVNYQNKEGSSALHTAAFLCRPEIVKMLLENGADPSLKNIYGSTALETVLGPFVDVKPIYDIFSKELGPLGLKLDYDYLEKTRPLIADMLR
jgi:hypothetical protein